MKRAETDCRHVITRPTTTTMLSFRAAFRSTSLTRSYVAVGGRSFPRPSLATKAPPTTQASAVQTDASKGSPGIVDGYPSTANEIQDDFSAQNEIINDTPAESIPSSAALGVPPPLLDAPAPGGSTDWSRSYHGLSTQPFPPEVADILQAAIDPLDIEMKPGTSLWGLSLPSFLLKTTSPVRRDVLSTRN